MGPLFLSFSSRLSVYSLSFLDGTFVIVCSDNPYIIIHCTHLSSTTNVNNRSTNIEIVIIYWWKIWNTNTAVPKVESSFISSLMSVIFLSYLDTFPMFFMAALFAFHIGQPEFVIIFPFGSSLVQVELVFCLFFLNDNRISSCSWKLKSFFLFTDLGLVTNF